jgi:hypothetical protein
MAIRGTGLPSSLKIFRHAPYQLPAREQPYALFFIGSRECRFDVSVLQMQFPNGKTVADVLGDVSSKTIGAGTPALRALLAMIFGSSLPVLARKCESNPNDLDRDALEGEFKRVATKYTLHAPLVFSTMGLLAEAKVGDTKSRQLLSILSKFTALDWKQERVSEVIKLGELSPSVIYNFCILGDLWGLTDRSESI